MRSVGVSASLPFTDSVWIRLGIGEYTGVREVRVTPTSRSVYIGLVCGKNCIWKVSGVEVDDLPKIGGPLVWFKAEVWYTTEVGSFLLGYAYKVFGKPNVLQKIEGKKFRASIAEPGGILVKPEICAGSDPKSLECREGWSAEFGFPSFPDLLVVWSNGQLVYCSSAERCWKYPNGEIISSCKVAQCTDCSEDVREEAEFLWRLAPNLCSGDPVAFEEVKGTGLDPIKLISLICPPVSPVKLALKLCSLKGIYCYQPLIPLPQGCKCLSECREVAGKRATDLYYVLALLILIGTVYAVYQLGRCPCSK